MSGAVVLRMAMCCLVQVSRYICSTGEFAGRRALSYEQADLLQQSGIVWRWIDDRLLGAVSHSTTPRRSVTELGI